VRKIEYARSKVLPDGNTVFECPHCSKTVARTVDVDGYWRLKIFLTGRQKYTRAYEHPDSETGTYYRHNSQKLDSRSHSYNLGGRCPEHTCNRLLELDREEVVLALGYESFQDFCESNGIPPLEDINSESEEDDRHYEAWSRFVMFTNKQDVDPFTDEPFIPSDKQKVRQVDK